MNRKGENEKKKGNSSIITLFYPYRVCLYFIIISIVLGFIGGVTDAFSPSFSLDDAFYSLIVYPIFTIISGIYTRNPIYGAICGFLCGFFYPIGFVTIASQQSWYWLWSDALLLATCYSMIGAVSGVISDLVTKKLKTPKSELLYGRYGRSKSGVMGFSSIRTPKGKTIRDSENVTTIYNIEEVGGYAECPYCGSNIRETFYELGGVVRCDKCGAFHHKECFEYYGRKCGSSSCKLKNA